VAQAVQQELSKVVRPLQEQIQAEILARQRAETLLNGHGGNAAEAEAKLRAENPNFLMPRVGTVAGPNAGLSATGYFS